MLRPDIIEKIRREREERQRPSLQIPLPAPEVRRSEDQMDRDEETDHAIVIDLV